jgi:hypothetical protein
MRELRRLWDEVGGDPEVQVNRIRKTLAEEGIAEDIDKLVEKLLGPV